MTKYKKQGLVVFFAVFICLSATASAVSAASISMPGYSNVDLVMADNQPIRFGDGLTDTYNFFNGGGLNAVHISNNAVNKTNYGEVTKVATVNGAKTGTFYFTDTGGRGWQDDGILMIAVNGTEADLANLSITINASGYQWSPISSGYPAYNTTTYSSTWNGTYSGSNFFSDTSYNSTWKPAPTANYPFYDGQNVTLDQSNGNNFHIIFVDLYAGIIGTNTLSKSGWSNGTVYNKGAIKVNYAVNGLPQGSLVAFDPYAYCQNVMGGGVHWTNAVNTAGNNSGSTTSGYYVYNW